MRKRKVRLRRRGWLARRWQRPTAAHNAILFERFQIGLPPGKFGIILRADWHRPGGCRL